MGRQREASLYAERDRPQQICFRRGGRLTSLLDLAAGHGIALHRAGRGEWRGLCPLHAEDTPSFYVNAEKDAWVCFGCGAGGGYAALFEALTGQAPSAENRRYGLSRPRRQPKEIAPWGEPVPSAEEAVAGLLAGIPAAWDRTAEAVAWAAGLGQGK